MMGIQSNNETIPEFATVSMENRGFFSVLYEITDLKKTQISIKSNKNKKVIFSVYNDVYYVSNLNLLYTTDPWSNS